MEAIDAAIASPMVDVQFGPAGVQWCSKALLEAIAERSAATGRRVHMHLLETVYQRRWADEAFPGGIVKYLNDIGLLSERLTLAHCVHARPDELDTIAASGARIVTNFSSNLHIGSGLGPIADAHRRGCPIAVGVDGLALDEDDDALREMRLVKLAHGGLGYRSTWSCEEFFSLAVRNGRRATGAPGSGELVPGAPADFMVVDLAALDRDAIVPVDPLSLLFARGNASFIREVVVAGRKIVADGKPTGVDLPAIETRASSDVPGERKELRRVHRRMAAAGGAAAAMVRRSLRLRLVNLVRAVQPRSAYTASRRSTTYLPIMPSSAVLESATTLSFFTGSMNQVWPHTPPQLNVPADCGVSPTFGSVTSEPP